MKTTNVRILGRAAGLFWLVSIFSSAQAGFSGDIIIDSTLGTGYEIRAGGSGGGIDRGSNVLACGSSGAHPKESVCPNDATYTPSAATGGYQAWAVGVRPITIQESEIECYSEIVWVFSPWSPIFVEPELQIICEEVIIEHPAGTWGNAMIRIKWGDVEAGTALFGATPPPPTSVFAFHESLTTHCVPLIPGFCANPVDSNYVSDPGYEAEITFDDPTCDAGPTVGGLGGRDHDDDDILDGCFTFHNFPQYSTLPEDYQDTTKFDDSARLNIGFGSANAAGIEVGKTYFMHQFFQSPLQPMMEGRFATHSGSITSDLCGPLEGAVEPEYCHFGIDFASVGGEQEEFTRVIIPLNW